MDPATVSIIMTAVGWLAKSILKKALDIAWQQFIKEVGLHAETEELIADLKSFKVPVETTETKEYLKEVKELVKEAKDLLDELDYFRLHEEVMKMNKAESGNIFTKFKSSIVPSSSTAKTFQELNFDKRDMSRRLKDLIKKLKQKSESLNPLLQHQLLSSIVQSIQAVNNQAVQVDRPKTASLLLEDKIYGRDGEIMQIQNLINCAKQQSQKIPVIAIVGNGGTGKTTLAQRVYNQLAVAFDLRIWICVSTNFDEMGFTRQMLECCSGDVRRCDGENLDNLKSILMSKLKGKKVLLVLDDIWEIKSKRDWNSLLAPLNPSNGTMAGTVVVITTRFSSIAKMVEAIDPVISLDGLDESSSWSLLKNYVFENDQYDVPGKLENIGRRIVNRLRGYPLAAKTVGAILKDNIDATHWEEILKNEEWKCVEDNNEIMPTLRLSYEYLPIHLKQCFSYCSLFPKNYYFKAEELVYMWMAHDYINTNNNRVKNFHQNKDKRLEDIGFEYLNILVERAFFQKIVKEEDVEYVIHDLMHDLAETVSSEEILSINHPEPTPIPPNISHVSFMLDVKYTIENHVQFQDLSSLVIFKSNEAIKDTLNWERANRIRLHLLILPYKRSISYNFSHFILLRYLKLKVYWGNNENATFPVQICRLYHLQVLELADSWNVISELPKEFNNLVNLRHFIANEKLHSMISGVGRLKNLQELKRFVVHEENGFELAQLSELKELRGSLQILSLQNVRSKEKAECVRLSEKAIDNLRLSWDRETKDKPQKNTGDRGKGRAWVIREDRECHTTDACSEDILEALQPNNKLRVLNIQNYDGCNSPSWLSDLSLKYVEYINLSNCEAWEELPNFGQLMFLKELRLNNLPGVKTFGPQFHGFSPDEGFPSLKEMHVSDMEGLTTWVWSQGHKVFPSLKVLRVTSCPNLMEFSFFNLISDHRESTDFFPKLHLLTVTRCPQLLQQDVPKLIPFMYTHRNNWASIDGTPIELLGNVGGIVYNRYSDDLIIDQVNDLGVLDFVFRTFRNIRSMEVNNYQNFTTLSWKCFCMIKSLKTLRFRECNKLCFSLDWEERDIGSTSYSHELLEDLEIDTCGIVRKELYYLLAHLPFIHKLSIINCPLIDYVSLPNNIYETNRGSLEELYIKNSLACLEELYIKNCPDMVFANGGGLSGLTALKEVTISGSDKLLSTMNYREGSNYVQTLIVEHSNLTSLNLYSFVALREFMLQDCKNLASVEGPNSPACMKVFISGCPQLVQAQNQTEPKFLMHVGKLSIDNIEFLSVHTSISMSLHSLTINGYGSLQDWSEWTEEQENVVIKQLTTLEELTLLDCTHLRSLPSMLYLHPSLKELTIHYCREIRSLPQNGFPTSLQKFRLKDCSEELKSRCSQLEDFEYSIATKKWERSYTVFVKRGSSIN